MSMAQFRPADTVDFIVVGIGAAGGVMAKELSTAGFRVVALEQGPWRHVFLCNSQLVHMA